ncbi:MAG: hypothetical protein AB7L84_07590 [Acidimicrobiia bacterium]
MRCEEVVERLAGIAGGDAVATEVEQHHIGRCLRCQAELVQYRKVLRAMRTMRTEVLEPAPGVLAGVLVALGEAGERHAIRSVLDRRRAAYLGGLAAATAAGAGALVFANRSRRVRTA